MKVIIFPVPLHSQKYSSHAETSMDLETRKVLHIQCLKFSYILFNKKSTICHWLLFVRTATGNATTKEKVALNSSRKGREVHMKLKIMLSCYDRSNRRVSCGRGYETGGWRNGCRGLRLERHLEGIQPEKWPHLSLIWHSKHTYIWEGERHEQNVWVKSDKDMV